ncbi:DUF4189 domain-containing protein [Xanthomonas sp. NCPPB 2632]|uniref:DUF4189 domain-containing protein n=1 Tax=Xanthomonas sp. NCPPB 2632 TaxID=3240912 RepID=UPI0035114052
MKIRLKYAAALFLLQAIAAPNVLAQCATGVDTGGGNCVPPDAAGMPGYSSAPGNAEQSQPRPVWKDTWGAIVIDGKSGAAGTVIDRSSKANAINDAMHDCKMRGGQNCQLDLAFSNQCAAVAWGDDGHASARSPDKQRAENIAMQSCREAATTGCKVVYSECSDARRVK